MRAVAKATRMAALRPACAVLLTLLLTSQASAETIFKCAGKDGTEVYSNFPCESQSGSVVWLQGNAQNPAQTTAPSTAGNHPPPAHPASA